jgi:hypothetical protein
MDVKTRLGLLLAGTVLGTSILISAPALADDAQLQQQINAMQQQLQQMQNQLATTQKQAKAAANKADEVQQAQNAAPSIPPNLYNADMPVPTKGPPSWFDSIHVSMAGTFIAMEGAYRQRNEISSGASDPPFSTIPLQNSPLYNENELRFSAQQSRIALKASGDISPTQHVKGYYEMDFLGAAVTSNSRESNSYTPRIRQAYFAYDNDVWGGHFSAGQMWSLATQNRVGILNSTENIPLTIDAQYVAGFNWKRTPAIRFVEDVGKIGWFAVAVESPQTGFASNGNGIGGAVAAGTTAAASNGLITPPGLAVNPGNTCNASGLLNSTTLCSNNVAPDVIEKFALDPGWGHYEVYGLQRWFADQVSPIAAAVGTNNWTQKVTFGWGVGGSVLFPVVPQWIDLQGSILYGQGIGTYGSGQLADAVVGSNGSLQPVTALHFLVGAIAHPFTGNDLYFYYGQEQSQANAWTSGAVQGGWGNANFAEACAFTPAAADTTSAGFNAGSNGNCTANVQRIQEFTVGFWQDIYKGDLGRARVGLQYEYVTQHLFSGTTAALAGVPVSFNNSGLNPNNNIVFFSLRYYPFN